MKLGRILCKLGLHKLGDTVKSWKFESVDNYIVVLIKSCKRCPSMKAHTLQFKRRGDVIESRWRQQ